MRRIDTNKSLCQIIEFQPFWAGSSFNKSVQKAFAVNTADVTAYNSVIVNQKRKHYLAVIALVILEVI